MVNRVTLDKAGITADAVRFATPPVRGATRRVLNRSAVFCPVDTGRLRASGRMKMVVTVRGPRGIVEYPVTYAAAVEDGSAPHMIQARRKKALRFVMDGRVVFATAVRHPGTRPRPYLGKAARLVAAAEGYHFHRRN